MFISRYTQSNVWIFLVCLTCCSLNVAWEIAAPLPGQHSLFSYKDITFHGQTINEVAASRDTTSMEFYKRGLGKVGERLPANYYYPFHVRGQTDGFSFSQKSYFFMDKSKELLQTKEKLLCQIHKDFEICSLWQNHFTIENAGGEINELTLELASSCTERLLYQIVNYHNIEFVHGNSYQSGSVFYVNGQKEFVIPNSFESNFMVALAAGNVKDNWLWIFGIGDTLKYTWNETTTTEMKVNGVVITNSVHEVRLGETFNPVCGVRGVTITSYPVLNVTISCGSASQFQDSSLSSSLSFKVTKAYEGVMCHCSAKSHVTGCEFESTQFTLRVLHGPTKLEAGYKGEDPSICDGIKPTVDMYCDVTKTDVNPMASVIVQGLPGGTLNLVYYETLQDVYRFNFSYPAQASGAKTLTCVANNIVFDQIEATKEITVFVSEPPTMSPKVSVNNGLVLTNGTVHNSTLGNLDIECTVEGGAPSVSNITLKCNEMTKTTVEGTVVTLSLEIAKDPSSVKCECSAEHKSHCYNKKTEVDIVSMYGPTQLGAVYKGEDPSICDGIKPTVDMYCDVNRTDVYPMASVIVEGLPGGTLNLVYYETLQDVYRFNFSLPAQASGATTLRCVANNIVFNQIEATKEITVFVSEPPTMTPNVTINNGPVLTSGTVHNSRLGHLDIECTVEGGAPPVSNVTLKCNDINNTTVDGTVVTLGLEITKDTSSLMCECSAEHKSQCYNNKTEFDIISIYGPTQVVSGQYDKEDPSICDGIKPTVEMYCDVNRTDVHSIPSVTLQGLPGGEMNPVSNETLQDVHRFNFSFTPPTPGTNNLICVARNTVFHDIGATLQFSVFVNEPPTMSPNAKIINGPVLTHGTVHNSRLGHLDIECTVEGGTPPVSNVTLKCDDITNTTVDGTVVTLGLEITKDPPSLKCECSVEHKSHCYNKKTEFDILSIYGPTQVVPGQYDKDDPSICDGIKPTVEMYCDVNRTDVHSIPSVTLQGLPSGEMNPVSNETLQDVHRFNFSFTPPTSGTNDLICVAKNTVFHDIGATLQFSVFVNEPPTMSPNVTINNGPVLTNGTVHNSRLGHLDIECTVEGGTPPVSNVTLKCDDITNTTVDGTVVTLGLEITKDPPSLKCECSVEHKSHCYNKKTEFDILSIYGPTQVVPGQYDKDDPSICDGIKPTVEMYCDVNRTDVHSIPSVTLQGLPSGEMNPVSNETLQDVHRFNFSFTPPTSGTNDLICVAKNTVFHDIGATLQFSVFVNEPPTMSPNVTINNGPVLTNGTVHNSRLGHLDIECTVEGGTPPVSNVTLKCDDITNTTVDGTVVTLGLEITKDPPSLKCECSVEHKSHCYNKKTEFDILSIYGPTQVVPGQYDKDDPSICDGIKPTVEMYCDVNRTDVHSIPSVTLQGLPSGEMNPVSNETLQDVHRFNFSFTPPTSGTNDLICVAKNTVFHDIGATLQFSVFVNEPPTMSPNVTINNGPVLTNGTVHNSMLGHLDIECTVEGGTPAVSDITLKCEDITNTTVDGTVVTLGPEISKDPPSVKCECSAEHKSHCYNKKTEFDIVSIYGPTQVVPGQYDKEDPSICDGIKPTVDMYCDVTRTDVHSIPSVTLQEISGGDMNPVSNETLQDVHRFNFSFTPPTPGTHDFICVANNTVFHDIGATLQFSVFVNEPPTVSPNVTINNGPVLTNGTVHNSMLGQLDIECTVEGGTPPVSNITLKCEDITNTTVDGTVVTLGLEITKDPHRVKCECSAEHKSHCYNKKTEFDIVSIFGPTQVVPGQYDKEDPSICDGIKPTVDMYCDVNRTDVHSIPSVTLQGLPGGEMNPVSNETLQDVHRFNFSFTPPTPGTNNLICVAKNTVFHDIGATLQFSVFVNEPPAMSPNVKIINGPILTNGTVHNARLGHLDIECTVEGGTPPVSNVTLKCDDITNTTVDGTVVTLGLEITKDPPSVKCKCSAEHKSQCYNKMTEIDILSIYGPTQVVPGQYDKEDPSICDGIKPTVDMYCDVTRTDVHSIPSVFLQGLPSGDMNPVSNETLQDVHRFNFSFTPLTPGTKDLICVANNTVFHGIGATQDIAVFISEPPTMLPNVTIKNGPVLTHGTVHYSSLGHLDIECTVEGGTPPVSNITLKCDDITNTTVDGTVVFLGLDIVKENLTLNCECSAEHKSHCYNKETKVDIISSKPPAMSPKVTVINGPVLTNGTVQNSRLVHLDIECTVEGGTPPVSDITLKCDDITNTTVDGTVVTLGLEIPRINKNLLCECFADHRSQYYNNRTQFTISPTYGPTTVTAGPPNMEAFDLCLREKTNISLYCDINKNDVKPISQVVLQGEFDKDLEPVDSLSFGNVIRHNFQFRPTSGGIHTVNCYARNPVFNDIRQKDETTFTVHEPPATHPKMFVDGEIITNGNIVNASLGTNVEVVCRVEGGYPNVARVVVECDGETNDSKGTESAMTLQIQRATHQAVCKCHADHISGCYQKTTKFSIEVWEPTSITRYTLNSRSRTMKMKAGSTLTFFCQAEGIPSPNISIKGLETGKTIPGHITTVNYYTSRIELTKPMTCDESDSYVCTSDNGIAAQTSLDVLVTCSPQVFVDPTRNEIKRNRATVSRGGFAIFLIDIICRPRPIRYRLIKFIFSRGRHRRAATDTQAELDPSQFQASYKDVNAHHGQIQLSFLDTAIDDVNDYKLIVDNGVGDALQVGIETVLEEESSDSATSRNGNSFTANALSVVSIVGILITIVIIAALGFYFTWFRRAPRVLANQSQELTKK